MSIMEGGGGGGRQYIQCTSQLCQSHLLELLKIPDPILWSHSPISFLLSPPPPPPPPPRSHNHQLGVDYLGHWPTHTSALCPLHTTTLRVAAVLTVVSACKCRQTTGSTGLEREGGREGGRAGERERERRECVCYEDECK